MTLRAWRIVKAKHQDTAFSGIGARLAGGRWNSPGTAMVYATQSIALAMLEILVHVQSRNLLTNYVLFEVQFEEALVTQLNVGTLPKNWNHSPVPIDVQQYGDHWVQQSKSVILQVPSVIVPLETNYLINPAHKDFSHLKISQPIAVKFDPRLQ